jgi:hypothetical protein
MTARDLTAARLCVDFSISYADRFSDGLPTLHVRSLTNPVKHEDPRAADTFRQPAPWPVPSTAGRQSRFYASLVIGVMLPSESSSTDQAVAVAVS